MVRKFYQVTCDCCNKTLNTYNYAPTDTDLRAADIVVRRVNGKRHVLCKGCFNHLKNNNKLCEL